MQAGHERASLGRNLRTPDRRTEEVRAEKDDVEVVRLLLQETQEVRGPDARGQPLELLRIICVAREDPRVQARVQIRVTLTDLEAMDGQTVLVFDSGSEDVFPSLVVDCARRGDVGRPSVGQTVCDQAPHEFLGAADELVSESWYHPKESGVH